MGARTEPNIWPMATRWRRRAPCLLVMATPRPATIRMLSGSRALLVTAARPRLGRSIELRHPEAGAILGTVDAHHPDGIALHLDGDEHAVGFALAAIASDMTRPR